MSQSLIIRLIVQQVYLEKTLDATPVPPPPRVPRRAPRLRTMMFCARPGPVLCYPQDPIQRLPIISLAMALTLP